ncbi:hypothetical protein AB0I60_22195 [Actinosynnema sp. NPDC050436]|uniref:hypothetical protein n=1 Tax=Actinosynnema sp. NPDC050436 TaxID=3155659 RepID=UPI0033C8F91D
MLVGAARNRNAVSRVTGLARSTPGRLSLLALLLIAATLLVGALTAVSVQRRSDALAALADRSEPLAYAAQEVYRSMADADASAAGAFLSGGVESPELRKRYELDVARASAALSTATGEIARSPALARSLSELSGKFPVYTGLVETARTHNRQGNPVGAAYLREAAQLMREALLPSAQQLYQTATEGVIDDLEDAGRWPWLEFLLGAALITALVLAQRYLTRRTNRVFNVGLVAATAACLVSLLWAVIASAVVVGHASAGEHDDAMAKITARARIATLAARGEETLTLVARGNGGNYEQRFKDGAEVLGILLAGAETREPSPVFTSAKTHFEEWQRAHAKVRAADEGGDFAAAVGLVLGSGEAAVAFAALEGDLVQAMDRSRAELTDTVARARGVLSGAVPAVVLLALVAAVASTAGLWQRLKEYR